jgi:hypothetical protein
MSSDGHTTVSISLSRMSSRFSLEIISYILVWSHFCSDAETAKVNILFLYSASNFPVRISELDLCLCSYLDPSAV